MRYIKLDKNTSTLIFGLKKINLITQGSFLDRLQKSFPNLIIQAFDAKFIAGFEHIKMIVQQSWVAKKRGITYANKVELDLIMRVACTLQIEDALRAAGLKPHVMDVVVVTIGDVNSLHELGKSIKNLGKTSDKIVELSKKKEKFLKKYHGITDELIKATVADDNKLAILLAERASLLITKA